MPHLVTSHASLKSSLYQCAVLFVLMLGLITLALVNTKPCVQQPGSYRC